MKKKHQNILHFNESITYTTIRHNIFTDLKARHTQHATGCNFLNNWSWALRFCENFGFDISEICVKFWNADVDFPKFWEKILRFGRFWDLGKVHVSISKFNRNFRNFKSRILIKSERSSPIIKKVTRISRSELGPAGGTRVSTRPLPHVVYVGL